MDSLAQMILQGIEAANQDLKRENDERLMQEVHFVFLIFPHFTKKEIFVKKKKVEIFLILPNFLNGEII